MRKREAIEIFNDVLACHEVEDGFSHLPVSHHMNFAKLPAYGKPEPLLVAKLGRFL